MYNWTVIPHHVFILFSGLLTALFSTGLTQPAPAQKSLMLGLGGNAAFYVGDLTQNQPVGRAYPGVQLSVQKVSERWFRLSGEAGAGKYVAQGPGPEAPPGVKPSAFVQAPFVFIDIRANAVLWQHQKQLSPYFFSGAGIFSFNPQDMDGNPLVDNDLSRLPDETFNTTIFSVSAGGGIRARLHPRALIGLEYTFRLTPTDYLDNIGRLGSKPGPDLLHHVSMGIYIDLPEP